LCAVLIKKPYLQDQTLLNECRLMMYPVSDVAARIIYMCSRIVVGQEAFCFCPLYLHVVMKCKFPPFRSWVIGPQKSVDKDIIEQFCVNRMGFVEV
jgi:hypothetical protein